MSPCIWYRSLEMRLGARGLRCRGSVTIVLLALVHVSSRAAALRGSGTSQGAHDPLGAAVRRHHLGTKDRLRRQLLADVEQRSANCPQPVVDLRKDKYQCVEWKKACIDQNVIVSFDPAVHPTSSLAELPQLNVSETMYNIPSKYGIGDRYRRGSALRFPPLYARPSNDMEEDEELQNPVFSNCTLPLLVFAHYPYNAAETFRYIFEKLVTLQQDGFFNRHVTLVPGVPPGTKVPSYTKFWYGSLSDRAVVSLSQLSARRGRTTPSNATGEGNHVRCFERVIGCRIRYDGYGLKFYNAGQYVVRHYMPHILQQSEAFARRLLERYNVTLPSDPSVFTAVFISRNEHHSAVGRTILNEKDLITQCNTAATPDLPPPEWGVPHKRFFCFAYVFGEDLLMDLWLMRRVDSIIGMHGAGLTNSLFMKPGGSALEVRPLGFSGRESWANRYARFKTSSLRERPWPIFWYGIDTFNASLSEPSWFEKQDKEYYSKFRTIKARDRHVRVTWPSLRHQLLNMAAVARTHDRYMALRLNGAYYITDDVKPAELPGNDPHVDKRLQRTFTDPEAERTALLTIPMDQRALDVAAAPDTAVEAAGSTAAAGGGAGAGAGAVAATTAGGAGAGAVAATTAGGAGAGAGAVAATTAGGAGAAA